MINVRYNRDVSDIFGVLLELEDFFHSIGVRVHHGLLRGIGMGRLMMGNVWIKLWWARCNGGDACVGKGSSFG